MREETKVETADDYGILEDLEGRDAAAAERDMDQRLQVGFTRVELGRMRALLDMLLGAETGLTDTSMLATLGAKVTGALRAAVILDSARRRSQAVAEPPEGPG